MSEHECIDCQAECADGFKRTPRKIVTADGEPKRCTTHLRRFKTRQRQQARGRSVERTYDISAKDAGELLAYQGGRCWICGTATGASKILAVDHDHADDWVRGRLCSTCNQFIGRQLGDDPAKAENLFQYLSGDTPYRRMLAARWVLKNFGVQAEIDHVRVYPAVAGHGEVVVWWLADGVWNANYACTLDELAKFAVPKS